MEEFKKPCLLHDTIKLKKDVTHMKAVDENSEIKNLSNVRNPYKEPQWSGRPIGETSYTFEVLKSGQIIDEVKQLQKKAYWCFGRFPDNDIVMAHPTISRFHAVLQYRTIGGKARNLNVKEYEDYSAEYIDSNSSPAGWYIYDMGSTHGTFLNKQRIPPEVYIRIRVGHILRLGASSRSYILQGPSEDEEPESKLTLKEIMAKRQEERKETVFEKQLLSKESVDRTYSEGCRWGMSEDADERTDLKHNPYASTNNEEYFINDPKKTLRGYFEREGLEIVYACDEMSTGSFVCRVELPIDDANGRSITAEVAHKGKKKDCVFQCALEACRILDRHGVLRQSNQEPLRRKPKSQESDSDDDYLDRTGDVAKKKQRKARFYAPVTLTFEDLLKQEIVIDEQMRQILCKIKTYEEQQQRIKADDSEDLDAFMENIKDKEVVFDKTQIRKLRIEEKRLGIEKMKIQKLKKVAKPFDIQFGEEKQKQSDLQFKIAKKKQLPMIGKLHQFSKLKIIKSQPMKEKKDSKVLTSDKEVDKLENFYEECKVMNIDNKILLDDDVSNTCVSKTLQINKNAEKPKETETTEFQSEYDKREGVKFGDFQNLSGSENKNWKEAERNNKKRRYRSRHRNKREEIYLNDLEYETSEKYSKWIPPENQTGDGLTELNKKFDY